MPNTQEKFQQIIDSSIEFSQAKDLDLLLGKILNVARRLGHADASSIYIMEQEQLRLHHTEDRYAEEQTAIQKTQVYHESIPVSSDSLAAYVVQNGEIITIPDCSRLPENLPYTLPSCEQLQTLLAFPLTTNSGAVIGAIVLFNPHDEENQRQTLSDDDTPLLQLFARNAANAIERAQTTRSRVLGIIQILTALRDTEETIAHVNRVGAYASEIYETWAQKKGIDPQEIETQKDILRMAAMLHDVGKLAIPNVIRRKPGPLNQEEYATMKQHTVKGAQLLLQYANSEIEEVAAQIALTHHERWDGNGYPGYVDPQTGDLLPGYEDAPGKSRGKRGEEIPVFGRVVAIADVYDALSNHRVFREAWKEADVLEKLKKEAGTHFDPEMIEAFFASLETIHAIASYFKEPQKAPEMP